MAQVMCTTDEPGSCYYKSDGLSSNKLWVPT